MIRDGKQEDLKYVLDIYNKGIMTGTASFEEKPLSEIEGQEWFDSHQGYFPLLVFEDDSKILGYVTISPYGNKRETAYHSGELSIYISKEARGKGVGSQLMDGMIERVKLDNHIKTIISVITEGNEGSVKLHLKKGFVYGGRLDNVAMKNDESLNILFYQKHV